MKTQSWNPENIEGDSFPLLKDLWKILFVLNVGSFRANMKYIIKNFPFGHIDLSSLRGKGRNFSFISTNLYQRTFTEEQGEKFYFKSTNLFHRTLKY